MKQLVCPRKISISGIIRGCMLGYPPDTCEECTHPDKHYVESKITWASFDPETGRYEYGEEGGKDDD